jgi:hypothetical protein
MATLTLNPSGTSTQRVVLTASLTAFNINQGFDGQLLTVIFQQDATGSHTVTAGTSVTSVGTITGTASEDTINLYAYDALLGMWGYLAQCNAIS